jgi:hypothetical protein
MKKIAASLLLVLAVVAFASAQNKKELKFDSFSRIQVRSGSKVYVRQGSPQKVEFEGDREDIEDLDPRVEGEKLVIGRDNWGNWGFSNREDRVTVYITIPKIAGLSVAGSGDMIVEGKITADDLDLSVSGSGKLELAADASGDLGADVSGSGTIVLSGKCRDFDSQVSGSGRVQLDINVAERAAFGLSGSGKVRATGSAKEVRTTISGSGEVLAANFVTDKCDVRISGSGDVEINVNKELDAHISGSGSVAYKGNPSHVNSHSSGSGSVRKM